MKFYSIGQQAQLDGGKLRWEIAKDVLELVRICLKELRNNYPKSIEFNENNDLKQSFPLIRLLDTEVYDDLVKKICNYFFNQIGVDPDLPQFTKEDICASIYSFFLICIFFLLNYIVICAYMFVVYRDIHMHIVYTLTYIKEKILTRVKFILIYNFLFLKELSETI